MSGSLPLLRELIDLEELQSIQDSFARAAGISSVILSPEGEPLTRFTNPTGFCSLIQSTEKGKERCFRSFMEMGKNALLSKEPEICYCFAHGGHFVAPIIVDGEHKGTMFAGQFIPEKFSSEQLHDLETIAPEIDLAPGLLVKEAEKMRVVGEDVIRNYSSLLFKIVETIARRGAQAAELGRVNDALEKAHEALELRFRDIAGAMSDWVWEVDAGARYTYCSEKVKDVLGYTAEEMIGKTPFDLVIPDETESVGAEFTELVRERRTFRNMENWIRTKDGRSVCMSTSGVPILDDAGELLGYRGVDSDITERKNAEEALQKEKDRAQHYLDIAGVMFLVIGADRKVSLINKKGYEILGYEEEEEITGKDWFDNFIPERLRDEVAMVFGSLIAGEVEPVEYYENPVLTKHGEEKIVAWHNTILRDERGRIYATMASGEDITERKRAEEALREGEEKYRNIYNNTQVGLYRSRLSDGKMLMVNNRMAEMFGYDSPEEVVADYVASKHYVDPTAREKLLDILREHGKFTNFEALITKCDGSESWMQYSGTLVPEKGYFEGVATDITERKAAEKAVSESEGKLRMITASANDAILMMDHKGKISYWNKAATRIFDYTEVEVIGKDLHALLVPERFHAAFSKGFERFKMTGHGGAIGKTVELAAFGKDGKEFPVELSLSAVTLKGRWNAIGLIRDITERKAAEEELKKRAGELEKFNKLAVGRELKMIELKKEINALLGESGKEPGYKIVGES